MIKPLDDGIVLTLGKACFDNKDKTTLLVFLLFFMALIVMFIAMMGEVRVVIGAIFVLAVGCFFVNKYRHRQQSAPMLIDNQQIIAKSGCLVIADKSVNLGGDIIFDKQTDRLIITHKGRTLCIAGFADDREMEVLMAVLNGMPIQQRSAKIVMGEH